MPTPSRKRIKGVSQKEQSLKYGRMMQNGQRDAKSGGQGRTKSTGARSAMKQHTKRGRGDKTRTSAASRGSQTRSQRGCHTGSAAVTRHDLPT